MRFEVVLEKRLLTIEVDERGFSEIIKDVKAPNPKCPMCGGRGVLQ